MNTLALTFPQALFRREGRLVVRSITHAGLESRVFDQGNVKETVRTHPLMTFRVVNSTHVSKLVLVNTLPAYAVATKLEFQAL